jgi:DMSO/TMAO reductase YedYZ molybdopterin-dependent catalytic subunit
MAHGEGQQRSLGLIPAGVSGFLAAAAALSVGELVAALAAPQPGPVYAVANRVIDLAPIWFVRFGKNLFGLSDKPALVLGTIIISLLAGVGLGLASHRRARPGIIGIALFGLIGLAAIGSDAQGSWLWAIVNCLVAVAAGVSALVALRARAAEADRHDPALARGLAPRPTSTPGASIQGTTVDSPTNPAVTRRSFLNLVGAVGAAAALAGAGANVLRSRSSANEARAAVQLTSGLSDPNLEATISAASRSAVGTTPGITPLIVPNKDFYLIDTALLTPQVDPANWNLRIKGMVDRELTITYQELLDRARIVEPVTLSCVSNEVGGSLVGNAVWQGVPLVELLDEAGVHPGASQIASRSVDGWTCGFPTEVAYDGRTALVAIAMNDEPLPVAHGFPARLVVSGLYGYVSATKWLSEIELTTLDGFDGYWVPRGWSKLGPVKTESRIDTPRTGAAIAAGAIVPIAGVAWAPNIGIERVEVQIDDGDWVEAELGESLGVNAWRQWFTPWTATPGRHVLRVRATDASGYTQTADEAPPAPDGASGWHQVRLEVAGS